MNLREKYLQELTTSEVAEELCTSPTWAPELEVELCARAGMLEAWRAAGDAEEIEAALSKAAEKLNVNIENRIFEHDDTKTARETVEPGMYYNRAWLLSMSDKELEAEIVSSSDRDFDLEEELLRRSDFSYKAKLIDFEDSYQERLYYDMIHAAAEKLEIEIDY